MSPNDYNERFYHLVRRESFYAKRLSAMNEEICEAFLNISRFLIDEGYVNNAREVDNIVCLLYTSPSPRDRTRSRMPSSA